MKFECSRTLLACTAVIAAMAGFGAARADIIGSSAPPEPSGSGGTEYDGIPDSNWRNQSQNPGGTHNYDPNFQTIHISNTYVASNTKTVWMRLDFRPTNPGGEVIFTGGAAGAAFNNNWGSCMGTNPDGSTTPGGNATGARSRDPNSHMLTLWQTWTITPQPAREDISIAGILAKIRGGTLIHIRTLTACNPTVPTPSSLALLGLGGLAMARRRR